MTVTLVLRLLRGPLAQHELVGHAEVVATGESHPIRGPEDIVAVARAASKHAGPTETADAADHDEAPAPDHAEPGS